MNRTRLTCLFAGVWLAGIMTLLAADAPLRPNRNVTSISTSDSHFRTTENPSNNQWDHETIAQMNQLTAMKWPDSLGGDAIERPRGVMVLGDCIDDGDLRRNGKNWSAEEYGQWLKEFGLDGTDGFVVHPTQECAGLRPGICKA